MKVLTLAAAFAGAALAAVPADEVRRHQMTSHRPCDHRQ